MARSAGASMTARTLTAAQRRALEWLPADGTWRESGFRETYALASLLRGYPDVVRFEWRGAEYLLGPYWGLLPAGRALKAELEARRAPVEMREELSPKPAADCGNILVETPGGNHP